MRVTALIATCLISLALPSLAAHPDRLLRDSLQALLAGETDRAQTLLEPLLNRDPPNRLAELLVADIRAVKAGHAPQLGRGTQYGVPDLTAQAKARLAANPWQRKLGSQFYELPVELADILWVDTSAARAYWLKQNEDGFEEHQSFYSSIGSNGAGKQRAWDRRTPIGIYVVVDRLEGFEIHERYGVLAFPMNYPNAWDRSLGRTGDGIWLHGVEPTDYARPPLDSDGCVVLTNADLRTLAPSIQRDQFLVVIDNGSAPDALDQGEVDTIKETLNRWLQALERGDSDTLASLYLESTGETALGLGSLQQRIGVNNDTRTVTARQMLIAGYPGEPDLVLARFRLEVTTASGKQALWRSLYLRRQNPSNWKIAAAGY